MAEIVDEPNGFGRGDQKGSRQQVVFQNPRRMGLGCGTLLLIGLIVLFAAKAAQEDTSKDIERVRSDIKALDDRVIELQIQTGKLIREVRKLREDVGQDGETE